MRPQEIIKEKIRVLAQSREAALEKIKGFVRFWVLWVAFIFCVIMAIATIFAAIAEKDQTSLQKENLIETQRVILNQEVLKDIKALVEEIREMQQQILQNQGLLQKLDDDVKRHDKRMP